MKYCDMHCDALTSRRSRTTAERLRAADCLLECFAVFLPPERAQSFDDVLALCGSFDAMCARQQLHPVRRAEQIKEDGVNAMLTLEGCAALAGELSRLSVLYARGVRMCTLTWNHANCLGDPAIPEAAEGAPCSRPRGRGLTPFGREAVARMQELGMIVDVSHGSDALVHDVAGVLRGTPFVASHSNSAAAYDHARNLRDEEIRLIADSGGVVGLNFCAAFLAEGRRPQQMRRALVAHARAIVRAGGEDVLALGSDFDGIPPNSYLPDCTHMPRLIEELSRAFGQRVAEKAARGNFLRVLRAVCK